MAIDFCETCDNYQKDDYVHCPWQSSCYMTPDGPSKYKDTHEKVEPAPKEEMVNHPSHYNREGSMECIDEMIMLFGIEETMSFCKLTAHRYRYRVLNKWNPEEDMKKSDWYMNKYKELKELKDKKTSSYIYSGPSPSIQLLNCTTEVTDEEKLAYTE